VEGAAKRVAGRHHNNDNSRDRRKAEEFNGHQSPENTEIKRPNGQTAPQRLDSLAEFMLNDSFSSIDCQSVPKKA
jgi:hypothetical protein